MLRNGTVRGNYTTISADNVRLFVSLFLKGTFSNKDTFVEWFGAIPDNNYNVDSYYYLQYAIDNTPENSVLNITKDYYSSKELVVNNRGFDIYMTGTLYFAQNINGFVFRCKSDNDNNIQNHSYRLNVKRKNYGYESDSVGGADVYGILLEGIRQATFDIFVTYFTGGICLRSTKELDCTYNKFFIRTIFGCQKAIVLDSKTNDSSTTVAQNTFIGGRIGLGGTYNKKLIEMGLEYNPLLSILGEGNTNNNNNFFSVSFEGDSVIRSRIQKALFSGCRFEGLLHFYSEGNSADATLISCYGISENLLSGSITHFNSAHSSYINNYAGPLKIKNGTDDGSNRMLSMLNTIKHEIFCVKTDGGTVLPYISFKKNGYILYREEETYSFYVSSLDYDELDKFKNNCFYFHYNTGDIVFKKNNALHKTVMATKNKNKLNIPGDMAIVDGIPRFCKSNEGIWCFADGAVDTVLRYGTTENRPEKSLIYIGFQYFDTTIGKPIWYKGSNVWVDATGIEV